MLTTTRRTTKRSVDPAILQRLQAAEAVVHALEAWVGGRAGGRGQLVAAYQRWHALVIEAAAQPADPQDGER